MTKGDKLEMIEDNGHDAMGKVQRCIKRGFDLVAAFTGIVVCSPVFLIISLLITYQGNGPVFFRQIRIGYKGRPFAIFKFRTMSSVVEEEGPQLVAGCDETNSTRLEQFLRGHHLDELPQLWNVLRGDMSFVGPRPERKFFIDKIMEQTDRYRLIYLMRPGLTSEATLYNGYTDTMEKMLRRMEMDIHYLKHRTLRLDLNIILKTILNIATGKKF
jgi:bacterial sugar transferase